MSEENVQQQTQQSSETASENAQETQADISRYSQYGPMTKRIAVGQSGPLFSKGVVTGLIPFMVVLTALVALKQHQQQLDA